MIVLHLPLVSSGWHCCDAVLCVNALTPVADQGGCQCQCVLGVISRLVCFL